jgi:hypothetical protein
LDWSRPYEPFATSVTSDAKGRFRIPGLTEPSYNLRARGHNGVANWAGGVKGITPGLHAVEVLLRTSDGALEEER